MNGPVLLIEDHESDAELIRLFFRRESVRNRLVVATTGEEALTLLFEQGLDPEFILLDLNLPGMDGFQILEALRADWRTASIPVIVLTVSSDYAAIRHGYEAGANHYLVKPFDFVEFLATTRQLKMGWSVTRTRI